MPSAAKYSTYGLTTQVWPFKSLAEQILVNNPVLGLVRKEENWTHEKENRSIGYGGPQGIGRTYQDAKLYRSASQSAAFVCQTKELYGSFTLEGKLLRVARQGTGEGEGILVDPIKREGKNMLQGMRNKISRWIHGDGVGALGRMTAASTPTSSLQITLRSGNDLKNFRKNMPVQFEATGATGGTVKAGVAIVDKVGTYDNPTITFVGTANLTESVPLIAASDFLYLVGTYDNAPVLGFEAWNPNHTGAPGTFLSVPRNDDPEWLAGQCLDGRKKSVLQRIQLASQRVVDAGGSPDVYFLSTRNFMTLKFELEGKIVPTKMPAAKVGKIATGITYEGVEVTGVGGALKVFPEIWMPDDVERCGQLDTLYLGSIGPFIGWDEGNGPNDLRTEDGSDSREVRAIGDIFFGNDCPGYWCRVQAA